MPIYEYKCGECGEQSEILVRSDTTPACEHCGSENLSRTISLFAVNSPVSKEAPTCAGGCGGGFNQGQCGSGMCGGH